MNRYTLTGSRSPSRRTPRLFSKSLVLPRALFAGLTDRRETFPPDFGRGMSVESSRCGKRRRHLPPDCRSPERRWAAAPRVPANEPSLRQRLSRPVTLHRVQARSTSRALVARVRPLARVHTQKAVIDRAAIQPDRTASPNAPHTKPAGVRTYSRLVSSPLPARLSLCPLASLGRRLTQT